MQIFALFMLCGVFTTLLIPETKRKTLEELSGEDYYNNPTIEMNTTNSDKLDDPTRPKDPTMTTVQGNGN
jgi:hypothetical protein